MIPQHLFIGGGAQETIIGLFGLGMLLVSGALIWLLPRRYIVIPLLLAGFLIPSSDVLVVWGSHFPPARILALFCLTRIGVTQQRYREGLFAGGMNGIDRAFLISTVVVSVNFVLIWKQWTAVVTQIGSLLGSVGMYVSLRFLIRTKSDILRSIETLAYVALANAIEMTNEKLSVRNLFVTILGGVDSVPLVREGRIRSQGSFGHAILAGTFGAIVIPLCWVLWREGNKRLIAGIGSASAFIMILTSASSTPLMGVVGLMLGIVFWPLRKSMQAIRWGVLATVVALQCVMKAPVWFLIARVDLVGGSAAFDRANLIDTCVRHFWDWWLIGTRDIGSWGWSMWDLSDTYVSKAETGGLLGLVFFIVALKRSFARLGDARKQAEGSKSEFALWLLGTALFVNIMTFFGVSYWDQTEILWLLLLTIISASATFTRRVNKSVRPPTPIETPTRGAQLARMSHL